MSLREETNEFITQKLLENRKQINRGDDQISLKEKNCGVHRT